jgi:predicted DCC family thiol-disulfide oxidoreductase YuxK
MQRYLLFDSHCESCSQVAEVIRRVAPGRLDLRSLHDADMKRLLDQRRPGWRWEPMLIEQSNHRIKVLAGWQMAMRLVRLLGPRRAAQVLYAVAQRESPQAPQPPAVGVARRRLLAMTSAAMLGLLCFRKPAVGQAREEGEAVTDAETLGALRGTSVVDAATQSFGPVDWTAARQVVTHEGRLYVLPHLQALDTFTVLDDPASRTVVTGVSLKMIGAQDRWYLRLFAPNGEFLLQNLYDRDGNLLAQRQATQLSPDGITSLVSQGAAVAPMIRPRRPTPREIEDWLDCMRRCLKRHRHDIALCFQQACFSCIVAPSWFSCLRCALCLGPGTLSCIRECNCEIFGICN